MDLFSPKREQLIELVTLLFHCDADTLEISPKMLSILGDLPPFGSYVLRVTDPSQADLYPIFDKYICERQSDERRHVYAELIINDVGDTNLLLRHQHDKLIRISGLDDLIRRKVDTSLAFLKGFLPHNTEFSPGNSLSCAVAATMEWIGAECGNTVVTSFGGLGEYAPFEETLLALRQIYRRHPQTEYEFLPRISVIMQEITGAAYNVYKPVIGEGIFTVESGIHIGGILKHPKCYELYPPEMVGRRRIFTYGKFSGRVAIQHKLKEMNIAVSETQLEMITKRVKDLSSKINRLISEEELCLLAQSVLKGGGKL